jgi:hypothetical protein
MTGSKEDCVGYRLDRSAEIFEDAKIQSANKRWRSRVNRLYYSSFHLINALLCLDTINAKSHDGLKTKFLQLYIKIKKIDSEYGKLFSRLIDWRQESDYSIYVEFEEEDILPLINKVESFNQTLIKEINNKT